MPQSRRYDEEYLSQIPGGRHHADGAGRPRPGKQTRRARRPGRQTRRNTQPLKGIVKATIETSKGTIELELDADKAPLSVANFVNYAKKGPL